MPDGVRPVPLFMDVNGSLLAHPAHADDADPRLRAIRLDGNSLDGQSFETRIWFDPVVIVGLNRLVDEGLIQLIWASTWDHAANTILAPAVGLIGAPYDVAETKTRYGDQISAGIWVKTLAVGRWLRDHGLQNFPIIMVDDLLAIQTNGFQTPQRRSIEAVGGEPSLFIGTHREHGLEVEHMTKIRAFAERVEGRPRA